MLEIKVLKKSGRKAKVALYYRLPARLQGFDMQCKHVEDEETEQLCKVGEVVEFIIMHRFGEPNNPQAVKDELARLWNEKKDAALQYAERLVAGKQIKRKDGIWEK